MWRKASESQALPVETRGGAQAMTAAQTKLLVRVLLEQVRAAMQAEYAPPNMIERVCRRLAAKEGARNDG